MLSICWLLHVLPLRVCLTEDFSNCYSLKDFAGQHTVEELLTEEERGSLVEALKSALKAAPTEPVVAPEAAPSGASPDAATPMEQQQGKAAAGPEAGGAQPAAEGTEAGSALPNGHTAPADMTDVIMADGAEPAVSDDDVKLRWLAGLEAVYQVLSSPDNAGASVKGNADDGTFSWKC